MSDMTEFGASAEPRNGGEVLKARFRALVEAKAFPTGEPDAEQSIVRLGAYEVSPVGPILFDGVRFSRQQFIDWSKVDEPSYYADTISVTFGSASIYEITYDAMSDDFNSVQTGPGNELFAMAEDTQHAREKAAQTLVDWIESVEADLQVKEATDLSI